MAKLPRVMYSLWALSFFFSSSTPGKIVSDAGDKCEVEVIRQDGTEDKVSNVIRQGTKNSCDKIEILIRKAPLLHICNPIPYLNEVFSIWRDTSN